MPVVALIDESTDETWSVLEVSSFQLESTELFHPTIAVILNITPDHLDRHGSFENYALAKERIFAAQDGSDHVVLNADNARAAEAAGRSKAAVHWFSLEHPVKQGAWVEDGFVVYRGATDGAAEKIMPLSGIPLKGQHNVENVLAAVCATRLAGAAPEAIREQPSREFHAVEHRLRNLWPPSMEWTTTTIRRLPTWTLRPRRWRRFLRAFTSSLEARTRTPITRN